MSNGETPILDRKSREMEELLPKNNIVSCPVCRQTGAPQFHLYKDMKMHKCKGCKTVFLNPLPSMKDITAFYHDSYQNTSTGYFAKVFKKMKRSRGRVKYMSRFISSGAFLDIGSNGGFMVEAARENGFLATGVEIDSVSVKYAQEHYPENNYFTGTIEDFANSSGQFDLAYCSEVIEHVPDVIGFVEAISKVLRKGGVLYITTPDISHFRVPRDLTKWDAYGPPSHCIFFTPNSLKGLLERFGFRILKRRIAFKPGIKLICERL